MNLDAMNATPSQREAITCTSRPLVISAGAGSGKTFTLQQRIVYALSPESGPLLSSVDELCAITFTEKAAAEIKSRVRSALRAEGLREQALRVDAAWISTIHGACRRILKEHALELGLAPDFDQLSSVEEQTYMSEAISRCLKRVDEMRGEDTANAGGAEHVDPVRLRRLIEMYGTKETSPSSLPNLVRTLLDVAARLPRGLDDIDFGPASDAEPAGFCRALLLACEGALALGVSPAMRGKLEAMAESLTQYLAEDPSSWPDFEEVLLELEAPKLSGVRNEEIKEAVRLVRRRRDEALVMIDLMRGRDYSTDLVAFSRSVQDEYTRLVLQAGALDTDMLLTQAYRALRDFPRLAEQYRKRFRLVMVDEFQDTNALQTAIVKLLCRENLSNLCTVGDSQQSIYGFQGADVGVYRAHKAEMAAPPIAAKAVSLDANFRSHRDILQFVEHVCGVSGYFPEPFLALTAGRDEETLEAKGRHYRAPMPRLSVSVAHVSSKGRIADAHVAEAEEIAAWFSALREAGHSPQQMAVLFGVTTQMAPYAEALRAAGFSCAFSGGSKFYEAEEVRLIGQVLAACANAENTEALFAVLISDIFRLSADDLVFLGTKRPREGAPDQTVYRLDIFRKFFEKLGDEAPRRVRFAQSVMQRAWNRIGSLPPHEVVRLIFAESGWFMRCEGQGAEGLAQAGNVNKALSIIAEIEREPGVDMAQAAARFNALSSEKEHMGVLAGKSSESIRLMTVHGAKGLEFPFVAVVDCYGVQADGGALVTASVAGSVEASLLPPTDARVSGKGLGEIEKLEDDGSVQGGSFTLLDYRKELDRRRADEALAEKRRLFYVAATRASEAMLLSLAVKGESYAAIHRDIADALFADGVFPPEDRMVDYGGSEPLAYRFIEVDLASGEMEDDGRPAGDSAYAAASSTANGGSQIDDGRQEEDAEEEPACIAYPVLEDPEPLASSLCPRTRQGFVSYSSLAASHGRAEDGEDLCVGADHADGQAGNSVQSGHASAPIRRPGQDDGEVFAGASAVSSDDGEEEAGVSGYALGDADKATDFGTALHRLCQLAALIGEDAARGRIDAMALTYDVNDRQRLAAAFERWLSSGVKRQAWSFARRLPELPFALVLDGRTTLEGEIDLLCDDGPLGEAPSDAVRKAFIVDYKTGGSSSETPEQLHEKHHLQASCYALAALSAGYREVELHFVRVEQPDALDPAQPQVISYRFSASDHEDLLHDIKDL